MSEAILDKEIKKVYESLLKQTVVKDSLTFIKSENEHTLEEQIDLTEIPAPTFQEKQKGVEYKKRLELLGLEGVHTDETGNVFGVRRGTGNGPTLVVCAHLDTVFPEGTDVKTTRKDGKVYGPGISDDGRGLTAVLTILRTLQNFNVETEGDILFGATVGEEGLGDLNGVKAFFNQRNDIDGFISIEPGSPSRTIYLGTGSRRYSVTYRGPGGHSFGEFGLPSAIHACGRAVAKISAIVPPEDPKTTFTVGTISGGTSVNTIAGEANMLIDLRSISPEELTKLEEKVLGIINEAADEENKRWDTDTITVESKLVGDRPAGSQSEDAPIVQAALAATDAVGYQPALAGPTSTDSNVPISLGIPAVTLGGGGQFGGVHTLDEYFDPTDSYYGPQQILLTVLGLVGLKDVNKPLLKKRS
ncbi:peptidase M20 [Salipaludibacillus keqinensis]|uniref:Peptidase M20 n=1 Tax=Salipaludibacillus keqinensis TaxID=2045207 RepID=A0A323TZF7_9BACI|nr:M20/M25/M40 family metallo-hydrolase [Salipaludibacillus keqinensis]PYZ94975.1 peptidase M20 [Salipaludibacillus keqinensis]